MVGKECSWGGWYQNDVFRLCFSLWRQYQDSKVWMASGERRIWAGYPGHLRQKGDPELTHLSFIRSFIHSLKNHMLLVTGLCSTGLTIHWEENRSENWQELSWGSLGMGTGWGVCARLRQGGGEEDGIWRQRHRQGYKQQGQNQWEQSQARIDQLLEMGTALPRLCLCPPDPLPLSNLLQAVMLTGLLTANLHDMLPLRYISFLLFPCSETHIWLHMKF